jgi:hypothetical protein
MNGPIRAAALVALLSSAVCPASAAEMALTYPNGAVGTVAERCGEGDLCATLTQKDGSRLEIYNEGAVRCQPYGLRIVKYKNDVKLFDYEKKTDRGASFIQNNGCDNFSNTYMTLADGTAHLGIFQNKDGTLFARWSATAGRSDNSAYPKTIGKLRVVDKEDSYDLGDLVDGHPRRCKVSYGIGQFAWSEKICTNSRLDWEANHPTPAPSPSPAH